MPDIQSTTPVASLIRHENQAQEIRVSDARMAELIEVLERLNTHLNDMTGLDLKPGERL